MDMNNIVSNILPKSSRVLFVLVNAGSREHRNYTKLNLSWLIMTRGKIHSRVWGIFIFVEIEIIYVDSEWIQMSFLLDEVADFN